MVSSSLVDKYMDKFGDTFSLMIYRTLSEQDSKKVDKMMESALKGNRGIVTDNDIMPSLTADIDI